MRQELFDKILREAKEIPEPFVISPFKLGEPLIDPLFSQRLLQIDRQLPKAYIELHTNLNYMPDDFIPALRQLTRVSHVWVSLNQRTYEAYDVEMGLRLDRTLENLTKLLAAKLPHTIAIGRVAAYDQEDQLWFHWAKQAFPTATITLMYRGDWCNNVKATKVAESSGPCRRTHELSICCDGNVSYCCMDGLNEYSLGNVTVDNIIDVYNGPKAKAARAMIVRNFPPCNTCTFL
jgi:MoaA/NifB/PqqE/SkfB family radical SAM enzyme